VQDIMYQGLLNHFLPHYNTC